MAVARADIEEALKDAHLPALMAALVQMTGDTSWLRSEWTPVYNPLSRGDTGIPEDEQARIRKAAAEAIAAYLDGKPMQMVRPDHATICKQMDFVAGAPIPEQYVDFLVDELVLEARSSKDPHFEAPELKAAARRMKVLIVGAGMSGLLTGIRLGQAGVPFEIVDKNPDVGGTWFENTYPGCRVDNSNHMYSYSFEPNHAWPQHFSPQPVLLDYFRSIAAKYDLKKHIRFETQVELLAWDEGRQVWRATLKGKDGKTEVVEATAVVTAVGQLNKPRFPDIDGIGTFEGPAFHSAEWRHDVDLKGKRVAVIGTGASSYQFVPEIAPDVAKLTVFQRNPPWGLPVPHYHEDVPEGMKWTLEHVPYYDKWYRFWLFWMTTEGFLPMVKSDPAWNATDSVSGENAMLRAMAVESYKAQLADRPDLLEKVTPNYPVGGKRAVLDNGVWLAALKRPNVELVTEKVAKITPKGVVTADGAEHEADVLIYGTGFQASNFLSFLKIKGRGGRDLHETWGGDARAYLGITHPDFPNLFTIYGPNTNIVVNGSIIFFSECAVRYIIGCLKLLAETGAATLEPKRSVYDDFNRRVDEANAGWAWGSPNVSSWYKNQFGRVSQNWPFGLIDYWRATLAPNPDDYVLKRTKEPVA